MDIFKSLLQLTFSCHCYACGLVKMYCLWYSEEFCASVRAESSANVKWEFVLF